MAKYLCTFCAYVYDEELGDPNHGIAPGTKFDDLPPKWKCPTCMIPRIKPGLFRKL